MTPAQLDFPPLHCSLERELGDYYQDFTGALRLVEGGYHGPLDSRGIPRVRFHAEAEAYSPITVAQYALANISAVRGGERDRTERVRALSEWLIENQVAEGPQQGLWLTTVDNRKYPWLKAPWASALAQGNGASALLRAHELLDDVRYSTAARLAYEALHRAAGERPLCVTDADELWYEEYPASRPLHVLNGHVYALFGVLDVARHFGDAEALRRWSAGAATLAKRLSEFDAGYWSTYDLRTKELVDLHYHKNIHIPQLRVLAKLTGEGTFVEVADRWEHYLSSLRSRLLRAVVVRARAATRRLFPREVGES